MKTVRMVCAVSICVCLSVVFAQAPVGTISGAVTDESGARIPNATIAIKHKATGAERHLTSAEDGAFSAPALAAGVYDVRIEAKGFRTVVREATVEVGAVTSADVRMLIGQAAEIVNVEAATTQIEYERHSIDGVVRRENIQGLPLNGRSFLQLAAIQPGVTIGPGTTSQYNALFQVSILGGGTNRTGITIDGGNVRDLVTAGTQINMSQEVVQEFQLSAVNFDLSTGITSVGSINVVTRSGSNDFHGGGYLFFRDHNMAAYPGLARNPLNPDPFFVRRNPGVSVSGPVRREKLFFFFNYEYMNQVQVYSVLPDLPSFRSLAGNFASPYKGKTFSAKFDYRFSSKHNLFARYSHDGNRGFGPNATVANSLPSNWLQNKNFSDQSIMGLTSAFRSTMVNDFRASYAYWQNRNLFADQSVCPGCIGLGLPETSTLVGSSSTRLGNTQNATQGRDLRRYHVVNTFNWQKGAHRIRLGGEFEHNNGVGFWGFCDPACAGIFSYEGLVASIPAALRPVLLPLFSAVPQQVRTDTDLLNLPFAGASIGVGDPSQPPPYNIAVARRNNRYRWFAQDTWKVKPRVTLNYGVSWQYESNLVNHDLDKPRLLSPLIGSDLRPTTHNPSHYSPSLGVAWQLDKSAKTVLRAGGGIYYETEETWRRLRERALIGPVGNGRVNIDAINLRNIFPNIIAIGATGVVQVPVGAPLPVGTITNLTFGQFIQAYNQQIPALRASLAPTNLNDLSVRNIQRSKQGADMYPHDFPTQKGYHFNVGAQRQLRSDLVVSADWVRRVFTNVLLGSLDYNRFERFANGVRSPVLPICTSAQVADVNAICGSGSMTFWTPGGRSVYNAMLVKVDKRFAKRFQLSAGYALTAQTNQSVINLDNWNAGFGPSGSRHILNVTSMIDLPLGFQIGFISQSSSRGPLHPGVANVDLEGDGTRSAPIPGPGVSFNCFNRGCGKSELAAAVASWNSTYAGKVDARGQGMPTLTLPASYDLGDSFSSQDLRLTKRFTIAERYKIEVLAEMFNVFNIANRSAYSFNLAAPGFGQPTQRQTQVFGSGGPRALQIGARISF